MTQPLNKLATINWAMPVADPRYRSVLESHMLYLRSHKDTRVMYVTQAEARPYYYNLYAYLNDLKFAPEMFWVIMRASNLYSSEDFNESVRELIVPPLSVVLDIITTAKS